MAVNLFQTGGSGNWGNTASWSLGTIPTSTDGHVTTFDGTSPNCTMGAARSCNNIDFTGYTNTLTMGTSTLTVAGNVTLDTGMLISGTGALTISATSTITSNGFTWPNNMTFSNNNTKTLVGNLSITGSLTVSSTNTINKTTTETITIAGGIIINATTLGTAKFIMTGGTWSGSSTIGIANDLDLQGNITISSNVYYRTGTLTRVSGTIDTTTNASNLNITFSATLDTDGVSWNNVNCITNNQTVTINSLLTATSFTVASALSVLILAGTHGINVANFILSSTGINTVTLQESVTYTITSAFNCFSSRVGSIVLFTSSHGTDKAILTLDNPASCNVLASFTRIDASNGRTIPTFNGTITDCLNIVEFHDLPTSSHAL
jgi:fibronectin-binding autotransporter adhesin